MLMVYSPDSPATMTSPFVLIFATSDSGSLNANAQIALKFVPQYPIVFLSDPKHDLSQTLNLVREAGGEASCFDIDLASDTQGFMKSLAAITESFGKSCAAAVFQAPVAHPSPFLEQTITGFLSDAVQPITTAYAFAQQAVPLLLNNNSSGNSVYPSTLIFVGPLEESSGNNIIDNALVALSRSLGRELGKKGIHVAHVKSRKKRSEVHGFHKSNKSDICVATSVSLRRIDRETGAERWLTRYRLLRQYGIYTHSRCLALATKLLFRS